MDVVSNCPPWTVRRLASHVLKNQLFWAGSVTGQELMALDESMGAVPYDGDLGADRRRGHRPRVLRAVAQRRRDDRAATTRRSASLPGAVVVDFAIIDAVAHAWDLSASVGRAIEFPAEIDPPG